MLLDVKGDSPPTLHKLPIIARVLAIGLVGLGVVSFATRGAVPSPDVTAIPAVGASLKLYAFQLFTTYLLPVQILGFLLLIAMLGVIVLSKRFEDLEDIR
jgi:NADH-quinone oxidoreductase subunit J